MGEAEAEIGALSRILRAAGRILVLTGAGCSTESGIPDYRDAAGNWKRRMPVGFDDFVRRPAARRRYWARSLAGWPRFSSALPNPAHVSLSRLEHAGFVHHLVTQNVDGLHQKAGSRDVIDLHGRLDEVECLDCRLVVSREDFQDTLAGVNPGWVAFRAADAPDGDADLEAVAFEAFRVPDCDRCGGVLKPAVVFFGERVPAQRVHSAMARLDEAGALLVVGSSLMIWSGYRFARAAAARGIPIAAVNLGRTRADALLSARVAGRAAEVLPRLAQRLGVNGDGVP